MPLTRKYHGPITFTVCGYFDVDATQVVSHIDSPLLLVVCGTVLHSISQLPAVSPVREVTRHQRGWTSVTAWIQSVQGASCRAQSAGIRHVL